MGEKERRRVSDLIANQELLNWLRPIPWELAPGVVSGGKDESVLSRVLAARGYDTPQKQAALLSQGFNDLPDPFLFRSMEAACHLIQVHLDDPASRILIFGDYDADGLTAASLLARYFASLGRPPLMLIPDRFDDGYGLSEALVEEIALNRPDLVITVDTGSSAPDQVRRLLDLGMDVVVTDHHQVTGLGEWPDAPLINPVLEEAPFPLAPLSGAGAALMLTLALDRYRGQVSCTRERLIVLATVGTVADVMPLTGANRLLVKEGLRLFPAYAPEGLKAVDRLTRSQGNLTARDIAFSLAPRLNAAGRMGDVRLALDLLMEDDPVRADRLARSLDQLNQERRQVEEEVFAQALAGVLKEGQLPSIAVAAGRGWHPGVLGIVSSRLVDKLKVPAITLREEGGLLSGSARTYGQIDLIELIGRAASLLEKFGGHAGAAGLTLRSEHFEAFRARLMTEVNRLPAKQRRKSFRIDVRLRADEIGPDLVREFEVLEPVGHGFENPQVWITDLSVDNLSRVGNGRHLKLILGQGEGNNGRSFEALFFGRGHDADFYRTGDRVEVLAVPEINRWGGNETVQLRLVDLRPCGQDLDNARAMDCFSAWRTGKEGAGEAVARMATHPLRPSLFAGLWQVLENLAAHGPLNFQPFRLAWLLSHRYNVGTDALGLLLALAVFEEAGLILLESGEDGTCTCSLPGRAGRRPALSEVPAWTELMNLGVMAE